MAKIDSETFTGWPRMGWIC